MFNFLFKLEESLFYNIKNYYLVIFLSYALISYNYLFFLNEEIIFDLIIVGILLILLVFYNNNNYYKLHRTEVENRENFYLFIIVFLKNWKLYQLRKQKVQKVIFFHFVGYLFSSFNSNVNNYLDFVNKNTIFNLLITVNRLNVNNIIYKKLIFNKFILKSFINKFTVIDLRLS